MCQNAVRTLRNNLHILRGSQGVYERRCPSVNAPSISRTRAQMGSCVGKPSKVAPETSKELLRMRAIVNRTKKSLDDARKMMDIQKTVEGLNAKCCVCLEAPVKSVLVPCGHMCMCMNCSQCTLETCPHCPLCRTPITTHIAVFFPQANSDFVNPVQTVDLSQTI